MKTGLKEEVPEKRKVCIFSLKKFPEYHPSENWVV